MKQQAACIWLHNNGKSFDRGIRSQAQILGWTTLQYKNALKTNYRNLMDDYDAVAASFPWREFVLFRIIDKSENAVQANHHWNV